MLSPESNAKKHWTQLRSALQQLRFKLHECPNLRKHNKSQPLLQADFASLHLHQLVEFRPDPPPFGPM